MTARMTVDGGNETEHGTTNGVNGTSSVRAMAADRAAFLAGELEEKADEAEETSGKGTSKDVEDNDADLDAELEQEVDADVEEDDAEDAGDKDDDSDLDEDGDEDKADGKGKVDDDTAKRLDQVRRTDKRLREQREAQFKEREKDFEAKVQAAEENLKKAWEPRIEKAERIEKLISQRNFIAIAKDAGFTEEDFAELARDAWTETTEGKKDPKNAAARAHSQREREREARVAKLEKEREDERKANAEREKQAEGQRKYDEYVGSLVKAPTDKTPLAKAMLNDAPAFARLELEVIAGQMAQANGGKLVDPKQVMIAYEKQERARLRRYGIDPKTHKPIASSETAATKTTPTKGDKKTAKPTAKTDGDKKLSPRDEFIRGGKFD